MIAPHLYELASEEQQKIMREMYGVEPFEIETISLERIFVDKVFAAQFYFERKDYSDVAKHVYDLTVLLDNEQIKELYYATLGQRRVNYTPYYDRMNKCYKVEII